MTEKWKDYICVDQTLPFGTPKRVTVLMDTIT